MVVPSSLVQQENIPVRDEVEQTAYSIEESNAHPNCTCNEKKNNQIKKTEFFKVFSISACAKMLPITVKLGRSKAHCYCRRQVREQWWRKHKQRAFSSLFYFA